MKDTGETPPDPDAAVFCTHECHRIPEDELESGD
jgi:hypothetical protein